jgi:hypothetical protein
MINRQPSEKANESAIPTSLTTDDIILATYEQYDDGTDSSNSNSHREQTDNQKQVGQDSNNETDESDESDDYDQFDTTDNVCGCGKTLAKGWVCHDCRIQCPGCNRALSTDPEDYCSRCYFKCQEHGLVLKKAVPLDTCHLCNDASSPVPDNANNDSPS